jgi:hypothetical protein
MKARIQLKSCTREDVTHHMSKTNLSVGPFLSADELHSTLPVECVELFDWRSASGRSIVNFRIEVQICMLIKKTQLKHNTVLC